LLQVRPAAIERIRRGAQTLRREDLLTLPSDLPPGSPVALCDERGRSLGSGFLAAPGPTSLAVRLFDRQGAVLSESQLLSRLHHAQALRQALGQAGAGDPRDAYRMVHGEADGLPGLFIDRYGEAAVIQTATFAMDARKGQIAALLQGNFGVRWVVCRDDGSARDLEGLPRERRVLSPRPAAAGESRPGSPAASTLAQFHDAGSRMQADLLFDRKTGSFLDQQENHARAAAYARRLFADKRGGPATALDTFTYHGGFALSLSRAGLHVTACDEDRDAIARARHNASLNGVDIDFRIENAFDLLRRLEAQGARFDVVVVDPPALAKRGRERSWAGGRSVGQGPSGGDDNSAWARAYRELNLRAMRILGPGGLLVSCSCSGRVSQATFGELLHAAAADARRSLQVLERCGAGADHPVLLGWSESEYLKCWFLRALS
jgi:23S rRNA (cytosine1962-C5)-methyltransferase